MFKVLFALISTLFLFAGCSNATLDNKYHKDGPTAEWIGEGNKKTTTIKITPRNEVNAIITSDNKQENIDVKNSDKSVVVEKIANGRYKITIKEDKK